MSASLSSGATVLEVCGLSRSLGERAVLDGVEFTVRCGVCPGRPGHVVGLLGPSGVGKSQLLRILAGLERPDRGSVAGRGGAPLSAGSVGLVFQGYPLLAHRTVQGNLEVAAAAAGIRAGVARVRIAALLKRFGLADRAEDYPAQLSGGQRQRVAIAQQLLQPDSLLLLDEPFSGLDPAGLGVVEKLITEVAHASDPRTVIVVTHDLRAAITISDTILLLGCDRDMCGEVCSGARVVSRWDLGALGIAGQEGIEDLPAFSSLEREIRRRFDSL